MTEHPKDTLLPFGKILARGIQVLCAVAGAVVVLLACFVLLRGQGMLPGSTALNDSEVLRAAPLLAVAIFVMMALILAALFSFFGKLRAIIVDAEKGDPFTPENADRLTAMAWLFLGAKILRLLIGGVRLHIAHLVDTTGTGGDRLDVSVYDLDAVVIVVVLFILARIFRHGAAMRDDLKGTV